MLAKVHSGAVYGIDAYPVEIEVNEGRGDVPSPRLWNTGPQTIIVGLSDAAVKESKDRVQTAIINSGFDMPKGRITINLAPADIKKEGPIFDLPIAVGILATQGFIPLESLSEYAMVGELALSGAVLRARGVLLITLAMKKEGRKMILVPRDNADEAAVVEGIKVFPVRNLREAADLIGGVGKPEPFRINVEKIFAPTAVYDEDFADVKGQSFDVAQYEAEQAKRAVEVAVAGGHNLLMIGPPGKAFIYNVEFWREAA